MSAKKKSRIKRVVRKKQAAPEHHRNLFDADLLHPHGAPRITFEKPLPPAPLPPPKELGDHVKEFLLRPDPVQKPRAEEKVHAHETLPVERKHESPTLQEKFLARKHAKEPAPVLAKEQPVMRKTEGPTVGARLKGFFLRPHPHDAVKEPAKTVVPEEPKPLPTHPAKHVPLKSETPKSEPAKKPVDTKPHAPVSSAPPAAKVLPLVKPTSKSFQIHRVKKEKAPRKRLQRKSLQEYLHKAGFDVDAALVRKRTFQILLVIFLLLSGYVLIEAGKWGTGVLDVLIFMAALWTAGFFGAFLAAQGAIYFFLDYRIFTRTREIEAVLPDFLQLASSNVAAGMRIDRALWLSIRPSFGVLAKEMEIVAKSTMAGESLEDSLLRFADAYESPILKRSVAILIEGLRAGGEMADLLNKIALNIEELKIMRQEMAANVTTYAIFITFASVMVAPFLFALATQLLEIIIGITGSLDLASSGSFFTINAADPHVVERFTNFSIVMLAVSTAFSAALVSVIKRGNVFEGIKSIPLYAIAAVVIYYLSLAMLHGMFGGILTGG